MKDMYLKIFLFLSLSPLLLSAGEIKQEPLEAADLAAYHGLYAASFSLQATGTQETFFSRIAIYIDGELHRATAWQGDSTYAGEAKLQKFTVIYKERKNELEFWIKHNAGARRVSLDLYQKFHPNVTSPVPRRNLDGSISFAMRHKDYVAEGKDWAPSTGHVVIVMETREEDN